MHWGKEVRSQKKRAFGYMYLTPKDCYVSPEKVDVVTFTIPNEYDKDDAQRSIMINITIDTTDKKFEILEDLE